jgi:ribosomal protein S12 methylthiotransferase accessory factor
VNQFLPAVTRTSADGSTAWFHDTDAINWWKTATVADKPYVAPAPGMAPRTASDYADCRGRHQAGRAALRRDCCEARPRDAGRDQTRPDVGLNVVKVIVPGCGTSGGDWRRGVRMTPVQMGWLARPPTEASMNPVSIFF